MITRAIKRLISGDDRKLGHGPFSEAQDGWPDAKPYVSVFAPGVFQGYDDSVWRYWGGPTDVAVDWLPNEMDAVVNQSFLFDLFNKLGDMLEGQPDKVRNDLRRNFHIMFTQDQRPGVIPPPGNVPPLMKDFLNRMGDKMSKPVWQGYMGLQMMPGHFFSDSYGIKEKIARYISMFKDPDSIHWMAYRHDLEETNQEMFSRGFIPLDFSTEEGQTHFENLTAWHGLQDSTYRLGKELQSTRMQQPLHGLSLILPKWGEVGFYAVTPMEGKGPALVDPMSSISRWADALFSPINDVVAVSIRGQIRAPSVMDNLLDLKTSGGKKQDDGDGLMDLIYGAKSVVEENHMPVLDNTEIIVAAIIPEEGREKTPLERALSRYGLRLSPLVDRQHIALNSTFPTYPRHVMRVPNGNRKRPELTNTMLPGIIAFSGLFKSTKPCAPRGVLLGLADSGNVLREVYVETDAPNRYNAPPGMLVTGRPGAGKSVWLLMITAQISYLGLKVVFFNPKSVGTMKGFFDMLGGTTITMSSAELSQNPGMADPVYYIDNREEVAMILADQVLTTLRAYEDRGQQSAMSRTKLQAEIKDSAVDLRNRTSYDILFGNPSVGTHGITDQSVRDYLKDKIKVSPFWRALVSNKFDPGVLAERISVSNALLIEWGSSMRLPSPGADVIKDEEQDTIQSIVVFFMYAVAKIGNQGGAIIVDESWVLKRSDVAVGILERGGREWRQADLLLILATQALLDWLPADTSDAAAKLSTVFSQILIMAILEEVNAELELDTFYKVSKLPRNAWNTNYIRHAGVTKSTTGAKARRIPRGYFVSHIYGWSGGVILGPWPDRELLASRTDKSSEAEREALFKELREIRTGRYTEGQYDDIMADRRDMLAEAQASGWDISEKAQEFGLISEFDDDLEDPRELAEEEQM